MRGHRFYAIAALTALLACALIAAGCGDDDDETTTTTSAGESAQQSVDEAVTSCTDEAQQLGGAAGTALEGARTAVGAEANQAISAGGENVQQALSKAEKLLHERAWPAPLGPGSGRALDSLRRDLKRRVVGLDGERAARAREVAPAVGPDHNAADVALDQRGQQADDVHVLAGSS